MLFTFYRLSLIRANDAHDTNNSKLLPIVKEDDDLEDCDDTDERNIFDDLF